MSNKVARTIYLTPELDKLIQHRRFIEDRTLSSQVERMLKKCLDYEAKSDLEAVLMSDPKEKSQKKP